jgi:hypothetical protein
MPQFDSGAAKQIGRFSEGLLLRLLQIWQVFPTPLCQRRPRARRRPAAQTTDEEAAVVDPETSEIITAS